MKLKSRHLAVLIVGSFVVGIGITMAFNLWRTEGSKVRAKYASGELAGEYNPADIRGSYSFSDITDAFDVPVAELAQAFGVSGLDNPGAVRCGDLEQVYGEIEGGEIGTDSVRYFVALYTGRPYVPEEDTLLGIPAMGVLRGRVSEEVLEEIQSRSVALTGLHPEAFTRLEHGEEDQAIKGKTTFGDLLGWGVKKEEIAEVLGTTMWRSGVTVRDYCEKRGLEFSLIKTKLQRIVDAK